MSPFATHCHRGPSHSEIASDNERNEASVWEELHVLLFIRRVCHTHEAGRAQVEEKDAGS